MIAPFRYRKLGHAALTVTDLERSVRFYRDLVGLALVDQTGDTAWLRCSRRPALTSAATASSARPSARACCMRNTAAPVVGVTWTFVYTNMLASFGSLFDTSPVTGFGAGRKSEGSREQKRVYGP